MLITVFLYMAVIKFVPAFADSDIVNTNKYSNDFVPCERGWYYFRDNCYKKEGRLDWASAVTACRAYGADLVSILSQEEQDFIIAFLLLETKYVSWIGLNDRDNESDYKWTDGSVFNYTNWSENEPSGLTNINEDCVYMWLSPMGVWNDGTCTGYNEYICKMKANPSKKAPNLMYCSAVEGGGLKYKSSCYHVVTEMKSWQNAEMHCKNNYNGRLISVVDTKEELFFEHAFIGIRKEIWIGIKIQDHFQQKWTSGWFVSTKKLNEIENFEEDTCVARNNEKAWIRVPCSREMPFICKVTKEIPPVLKSSPIGSYCPKHFDDWRDFGGYYCYYISTKTNVKFLEARSHCQTRGGYLVSIHSREEDEILQPFIKDSGYSIYIGLIKVKGNPEKLFEWADGSEIDYKNWGHGEPNRYEEECVEALASTMEWRDTSCNNTLSGFICSVKKIVPSIPETSGCSSHVYLKALIGVYVWINLVMSLRTVVV